MTKDQLIFLLDTKKEMEFSYKNRNYNLTYGTDEKGSYIYFGERYMQKKFYSTVEFLNDAKIENTFFREMLDLL